MTEYSRRLCGIPQDPALWFITWDPTQPRATRPLSIRKDATYYCYGHDLTKNVPEIFGPAGYIRTVYDYTPYGLATATGDVTQPLQWSSEITDTDLALIYYNYRHYNPLDGRWLTRDPIGEDGGRNLYGFMGSIYKIDFLGADKYEIGIPKEPVILYTDDYVYDSSEEPTWGDYSEWVKWGLIASGAASLRPDLRDALRAYEHYRNGAGSDFYIDYDKAYEEDDKIRAKVDREITEAQRDAEKLWDGKSKLFSITGKAVCILTPSTENWQKTLGGHNIWGHAEVETCVNGDVEQFALTITIHVKDRYNFDRGKSDIATGIPDSANGRFAVLGWAHPFMTHGIMVRRITWRKGDIPGSTKITEVPR